MLDKNYCLCCKKEIPSINKYGRSRKYCNRKCKGIYLSRIKNSKYNNKYKCPECNSPIRKKSIRCSKCSKKGKLSNIWVGDKIGYTGLHGWIKRNKPKSMFCEKCGKITSKLDCANISGEYKRDISDFRWLCRKCHMQEDGRLNKLVWNSKNLPRSKRRK